MTSLYTDYKAIMDRIEARAKEIIEAGPIRDNVWKFDGCEEIDFQDTSKEEIDISFVTQMLISSFNVQREESSG